VVTIQLSNDQQHLVEIFAIGETQRFFQAVGLLYEQLLLQPKTAVD